MIFGLFTWGGPVAQIALTKEQLVIQRQMDYFNALAANLPNLSNSSWARSSQSCVRFFFGCLSDGRLGGILVGITFTLPSIILILVAS